MFTRVSENSGVNPTHDIGKLLFAGFQGTDFSNDCHAAKLIRDHGVHCFLLQPYNFVDIQQLTTLIHNLQSFAYNLQYKTPLIIAFDQKMYDFVCNSNNGSVLTKFPKPLALTSTNKIDLVYNIGKSIALELRSIGVNMFFGPCLDICSKILMKVVGLKAFGVTVDEVIKFAGAFGCGLKNGGILSCAVTFPGLGNSFISNITEAPVVIDDMAQFVNVTSKPFKAMIDHDIIDSVLVTAARLEAIQDDDSPAFLNPKIVDGLLRDDLKFDKLVISDNLELQDIFLNYGIGQAAALAVVHSHCDMVIVCHNYEYQVEALTYLNKSFENGNYQTLLITALKRINEFLNKLSWYDSKINIFKELHDNHVSLSNEAYRESICVVRDLEDVLPIQKTLNPKTTNFDSFTQNIPNILVLTPTINGKNSFKDYDSFLNIMRNYSSNFNCSVNHVKYSPNGLTVSIKEAISNCSMLIFFCGNTSILCYQAELLKQISLLLQRDGKYLITVTGDSPYVLISGSHSFGTLISTYENHSSSLQHLPDILFGRLKARGTLPGSRNKHVSREEVVMGLNVDESEWNFGFLLNKPKTNKNSNARPAPLTNVQFDNSIFADPTEMSSLLGMENDVHPNSYLDLQFPNLASQNDALFEANANSNQVHDGPKNATHTNGKFTNSGNNNLSKNNDVNNDDCNCNGNNSNVGSKRNSSTAKRKSWKEKPWVVEAFDPHRDVSAMSMIRTSTISDIYYPLNNDLLERVWSFSQNYGDTQKSFVVRNSSMGTIKGIVVVVVDEYEKCGRLVYMVVSKAQRRQGIGESLHKRAIQYITIDRGCTTVALGCSFPFFNYLAPNILNEISSIWHYLETKDDSKIDIDDNSTELVGFYRSLGWDYTRYKKGVYQQIRKYIMHLNLDIWVIPSYLPSLGFGKEEAKFDYIDALQKLGISFLISDDARPAFEICQYLLKTKQTTDDEEVLFSGMYAKVGEYIKKEIELGVTANRRRSTLIIYAYINNKVVGAVIVYTNNSALSYCYPLIDQFKKDAVDIVAGITGIFVGSLPEGEHVMQHIQPPDEEEAKRRELIRIGLMTSAVRVIKKLDIKQTIIHNISKPELSVIEKCGFKKHLEYCACFGKKTAFEWVV